MGVVQGVARVALEPGALAGVQIAQPFYEDGDKIRFLFLFAHVVSSWGLGYFFLREP